MRAGCPVPPLHALHPVAGRDRPPRDTPGTVMAPPGRCDGRRLRGAVRGVRNRNRCPPDPAAHKARRRGCLAYGHKTALRRESAGELVRVPASQIVDEIGCTCVVCHAHWAPSHYLHLWGAWLLGASGSSRMSWLRWSIGHLLMHCSFGVRVARRPSVHRRRGHAKCLSAREPNASGVRESWCGGTEECLPCADY